METTVKKNTQGYGYKYADMSQIHNYLEDNNMKYYQEVETIDGIDYILTYRYIDGKWEDKPKRGCRVVNAILSGKSNPAQEQGSALTYARRYSLLLAFGLATEDDDGESLTRPQTINKTMEEALRQMIVNEGIDNEKVIAVLEKFNHKKLSELLETEAMDFRKELLK